MPSSYFSHPSDILDWHLFDGDKLRESVRLTLIEAAFAELGEREDLKEPSRWLHMWLTGSGISYQWNADRGNGDLDVQIGIDYDEFLSANPGYHDIPPETMASILNAHLKRTLWEKMKSTDFNGQIYEVTFFWNPEIVDDNVKAIHPYAAYDIMTNEWVVRPPVLPDDPRSLYPASWYLIANMDYSAAQRLLQRHTAAIQLGRGTEAGSAIAINSQTIQKAVSREARNLYDIIHSNRAIAFSRFGTGYGDYNNFRWQMAKSSGTIDILKTIIGKKPATDIPDAHEALEIALTWRDRRGS